jgi:hypothetical protein
MKIVDATGDALPMIEVRSDNGIVCHTRADGEIAWTETVLMDRDVRFSMNQGKTVTVRVSRGGSTRIVLR